MVSYRIRRPCTHELEEEIRKAPRVPLAHSSARERRGLAAEDRARRALEAAGVLAWEWDIGLPRPDAARDLTAWGEPSGGTVPPSRRLVHPEDREALLDALLRARRGLPYEVEFRVVTPEGRVRWLYEKGEIDGGTRLTGITVDVTDRRLAEQRLKESEERFRQLADTAPVLVWISDTEKKGVFFNRRWLEFTGRTLEQELGDGWLEGIHPEDLPRCASTCLEAFLMRREFTMEFRMRRHDGSYRWVLDHGIPRYTAEGEFSGFIGTCVDIHDRKEAEERLRLHAEELARSNADLSQFAYVASHDLKEPLRTVTTHVQLLSRRLGDGVAPEVSESMRYVIEGARRMNDLISDLLLYSSVGRSDTVLAEVDLGSVLRKVLANLEVVVHETGAEVTVDPLPRVMGNGAQLVQVLQNLLGNAIKFRGERSPRIHVSATPRDGRVVVSVRDNGIGIDPAHHDRIFAMFQRLHRRDQYPGTGIGLALCKKIVERHGGRIWLESEPGLGSTFSFTLSPP